MTTNVEAIRRLFQVDASRDRAGNLPSMTGIYPDYPAPIVRNGGAGRELAMARWGMPSSALMDATKKRAQKLEAKGNTVDFNQLLRLEPDGGTTNIRNVNSAHWKRWLVPEHRCLVPFTSFSEYDTVDGKKVAVWFASDESRPLTCFAGLWTNWTSVRKAKEGEVTSDIFAFLTCEPNAEVGRVHPKAMPVILTTQDERDAWLQAPWEGSQGASAPASRRRAANCRHRQGRRRWNPELTIRRGSARSSISTWTRSTRRSSSATIPNSAASPSRSGDRANAA
jgi:putative SOS response-associated peptidase YedK